jgi:hypothetical protein
MRKLLVGAAAAALATWLPALPAAHAQQATVVSACGTLNGGQSSWPVGQAFPLTMDIHGNLCFSGSGGGSIGNITQWNSVNLGSPTAYGTAPSGNVIGVNANVTNVNANGQTTMSNSAPVAIASDQSAVSVVSTPTSSSAKAVSHASVSSLGTSLLVKSTGGNLYGFYCTAVTGGAAGYCVAYNSATVPGTGALTGASVLDSCYFNGTSGGCFLSRIPMGVNYSSGIVILATTAATPFTYTTGVDTAFISADYN